MDWQGLGAVDARERVGMAMDHGPGVVLEPENFGDTKVELDRFISAGDGDLRSLDPNPGGDAVACSLVYHVERVGRSRAKM